MSQTHFSAQRLIDAPADVIYHCIADYREHHRPGGFLPAAFSDMHIQRGGVGAGTRYTMKVTLGGRTRTMTSEITEPQPGRVLLETGTTERTTFTVQPEGRGARVQFDTLLEAGGLEGVFIRLFAARLLGRVYADELERLERYAQAHAPLATSAAGHSAA
jgi:hypothetical protein